MVGESLSTAYYAAVINDLRAKRDELDRTICMLEARAREIESAPPRAPASALDNAVFVTPAEHRRKKPHGATGIGDACALLLKEYEGKALSTRDVLELVQSSGFKIDTVNPMNNVWSALKHRTSSIRDVQRVGNKWRYAVRREKSPTAAMDGAQVNGADHT